MWPIYLGVAIQGVLTGLVYGLLALGLSAIFGVVRLVNFAHGEFAVTAMYAARCLMGRPDLVMFDEPSLGLAPAIVQEVLATIRDLNRGGLTCILVEQNVALSLRLADRAYVLEYGRITLSGTGVELLADDRVRQACLGM
jgi:ABC-type branched-subunit amino acid transport system ATPase component